MLRNLLKNIESGGLGHLFRTDNLNQMKNSSLLILVELKSTEDH